jgi:flagellar biosynthetic protein FlhB
MAEEQDGSQKTEAPSQRRLEEARGKGQLVASREVATCLFFAASAMLCASQAPGSARSLAAAGRLLLAQAAARRLDPGDLPRLLLDLLGLAGPALALPLLVLMAVPVVAAAMQNAVVWTAEPLQPQLGRISPLAGLKRLFSLNALLELAKSLAKIVLVAAATLWLLWPEAPAIVASSSLAAGPFLAFLADLVFRVLALLAVVTALIAGIDYAHQRFAFMQRMRMSRQELRDELKQSEGDPHIRQRLRALRLERARRRMMADVPRATVVITNPTHVAVALRYVSGETAAPEVLAKGVDAVALRIRGVAAATGIPIVENPPLARALHAACEIGEVIPPAHYQAVAEVISYVLRLSERR